MASLVLVLPGGARKAVALADGLVLGRHEGFPVNLGYSGVSRRHVRIRQDGARWLAADLGSRNGTHVNGTRLAEGQEVPLEDGDRIDFGVVCAIFSGGSEGIVDRLPTSSLTKFRPATEVAPAELARDYELLRNAHALSLTLGTARDADEVRRGVVRFCVERLDCDHASIVELQPDGTFAVRMALGRDGSATTGASLPLSKTILHLLLSTGEGLLLQDAPRDFAHAQSVISLNIASLVAAPLTVGGNRSLALVLDNQVRRAAFSTRDLHVLVGVAAQASLALDRVRLLAEVAVEGETRGRLSRFLPPELVEQVIRGEMPLERTGREGPVAVLFADIRGFTPMAARIGPRATLDVLNAYFETIVPIAIAHGAMIEKFSGDEMMAVWGVPVARPDDGHRALRCGIAIQRALAELGTVRAARGEEPIRCGVGVNAGLATVGIIGADARIQYTVIGDTANIASRLCGSAGAGEVWTLDDVVGSWAGDPFDPARPVQLKGAAGPLPVRRWGP